MLIILTFLLISYPYNKPGTFSQKLGAGLYTVECYGAQGGQAYINGKKGGVGGLGAYVKGTMNVTGTGTIFYINIGS